MQEDSEDVKGEERVYDIPYTQVLKYPIAFGSEEIKELVFSRRTRAGDLKGMQPGKLTMDDMMKLLRSVTGQPMSVIEKLDADDFIESTNVINSFFSNGQTAGSNL